MKARELGYGKLDAYFQACFGPRVHESTVRMWVRDWLKSTEGFFSSINWGKNSIPTILGEEDVIAASKQWWFDRAPKKGALLLLDAVASQLCRCR